VPLEDSDLLLGRETTTLGTGAHGISPLGLC
jgi:hypothetical protein